MDTKFIASWDDDGKPYYTHEQVAAVLDSAVVKNLFRGNLGTGCVSRTEVLISTMIENGVPHGAVERIMIHAPRKEVLTYRAKPELMGGAAPADESEVKPVEWSNHVAAMLRVRDPLTGDIQFMVLDPLLDEKNPINIREWKQKLECENAIVTHGGLGQTMLSDPEYMTERQLRIANQVFEKLEMPWRAGSCEELAGVLAELSAADRERFESRFKNMNNVIRGMAYNVWFGQELNGNEDVNGVAAEPVPDWNEMEPRSAEWKERLGLAHRVLQAISRETAVSVPAWRV